MKRYILIDKDLGCLSVQFVRGNGYGQRAVIAREPLTKDSPIAEWAYAWILHNQIPEPHDQLP